MKTQESTQTRDHLSYRARVADDIAKLCKQSPLTQLRSPLREETLGIRFLNRLFKFATRYEVKSEEEFFLALRKTVESGRAVRVHLTVDCSLQKGLSFNQPLQEGDLVTSISAEARCSDNVTVSYPFPVDTTVKDNTHYKGSELNERATCLGALALLSFSTRVLRDFPLVPVECGPSNILSNRAVLRDVIKIAHRYGIEIPSAVAALLPE